MHLSEDKIVSVWLKNGWHFVGDFTMWSDPSGRPVFLKGTIQEGHGGGTTFGNFDNVTFPIEAVALYR